MTDQTRSIKFENAVQARELPPVEALERAEVEKKKTLELLISETDPDKKLPRLPQIREFDRDDWYVVNLGQPLKYTLKEFVNEKVKDLIAGKVPDFNVRGTTGLIEDRIARFFVTRVEQLVDGVIKYDSDLQGHFNLLLLTLSDVLQKYVNESISEQLKPKKGIAGLFSQPSIGRSDKDKNQKIYALTKGLRELVGGTIRKRIVKIKAVNPHAFKDTFGKNYSESIAAPLFGGMLENRNGLNPWLYFNVDPEKMIIEDFDQVLSLKYQNLTPDAIRKIEAIIGSRSKFLAGDNLQSILSNPITQSQFILDQKSKKPLKSEQILELKKSLEAYTMFITDLKKLKAIKNLQSKIHSNPWNSIDIAEQEKKGDFEKSSLGENLGKWEKAATNSANKLGLVSYGVQDMKTFSREQLKSVAYIDLVGSTLLKKELGNFMTDEEMEERQSGIFDIAADLCKQLGIAERNRAGDALVVSGHTALGMAYAMHKLGHDVLPKIDDSLKSALQAKIDHLTSEIRSLNDVSADGSFTGGSDSLTAYISGLEKEVKHEKEKQRLLSEYPLFLRAGVSFGKIVEGEHDDIGEVINDASRFTEHKKFGDAKKVSITDVVISYSGDIGKLDNQRGYVVTEKFIEQLYLEAKLQSIKLTSDLFEHNNGEKYSLLHYTERDGSEIILRTVGQNKVNVGEIKGTSIWKIVTDPDEYIYLNSFVNLKKDPDNVDLIELHNHYKKHTTLMDEAHSSGVSKQPAHNNIPQTGLSGVVSSMQDIPPLPIINQQRTILPPLPGMPGYQAPQPIAELVPYVAPTPQPTETESLGVALDDLLNDAKD